MSATDGDKDDFGKVRYSLKGDSIKDFVINEQTGEIKVANGANLDREKTSNITFQVEASDLAPKGESKSVVVPVRIVSFHLST